jgi:hypothetical protein
MLGVECKVGRGISFTSFVCCTPALLAMSGTKIASCVNPPETYATSSPLRCDQHQFFTKEIWIPMKSLQGPHSLFSFSFIFYFFIYHDVYSFQKKFPMRRLTLKSFLIIIDPKEVQPPWSLGNFKKNFFPSGRPGAIPCTQVPQCLPQRNLAAQIKWS